MNPRSNRIKYFWQTYLLLFTLIFITSCTLQDPVSIKRRKGNITGRVLPAAINATVSASQGVKTVATTTTDSAGYYYLANLTHGAYTLVFEANGFGTHFENEITVYEGGTTAIKDISLNPFPEQIAGSEPENQQQDCPLNRPITIHFNQPMDKESVENAFHVSPMLTGNFYWNYNSKSVTFQPEPQLMASENYQVILSTSAQTRTGKALSFPFTLTFNTTAIKVIQTSPLNGTIGISTNSSLMFSFNSIIDKTQLPNSFNCQPEIKGEFKWIDNQSFLFVPGTLLEPETDYQITLDSLLTDVYGKRTGEPFIFYFGTEPTRVIHTNPQNGASYVSRNTQILVSFNASMNQIAVQSAFQITPGVNGQFQWDNNSSFRFIPNTSLAPATLYRVRIETGAQTVENHALPEALEFEFTTTP